MRFFITVLVLLSINSIFTNKAGTYQNATVTCDHQATPFTPESFKCYEAGGIKESTQAFIANGAPLDKIAIGLPFYGRAFGAVNATYQASGLFNPSQWCYPFPDVPGVLQYFQIQSGIVGNGYNLDGNKFSQCRDNIQQSPYLYSTDPCGTQGCNPNQQLYSAPTVNFISYDDAQSIQSKVQYAVDNNIKNIIIWELYGDDCASTLLNAVHNTLAKNNYKANITAYYGNWRVYGSYRYLPYINSTLQSSFQCTQSFSSSQPVYGPRNWGITDDIASKLNFINHGFATVSYASAPVDSFFVQSPDSNADYQMQYGGAGGQGLATEGGCIQLAQNPICVVPYVGAYNKSNCPSSIVNSQAYMTYSQCSTNKGPAKQIPGYVETYNNENPALQGIFNAWCRLKQNNKNVKVGLSIGGWYDSAYFSVASSDKYRLNFAKSAYLYAKTFGFDGVDIDWEYPNIEHCDEDVPASVLPSWQSTVITPPQCQGSPTNGYTNVNTDNIIDCLQAGIQCQYPYRVYDAVFSLLLLRDLRNLMGTSMRLTMALRADPDFIQQRYPADLMSQYLDQFNDMTYDYNGAFNRYSSLNSPLSGCQDPVEFEKLNNTDCVTTPFGALSESNGQFVSGAWSQCFGTCNGSNYGGAGSGYQMQFKKVITPSSGTGQRCGKMFNIVACSGTCSQTKPVFGDEAHHATIEKEVEELLTKKFLEQ